MAYLIRSIIKFTFNKNIFTALILVIVIFSAVFAAFTVRLGTAFAYDSTVEENIRLSLCFLSDKKFAKEAENNIDNVLSKPGIAELRGRKVNQLSGGQKQRVAIARAMIKNPLLIIADEPTGALDRNTANEITDVLINAVKESGATLIVATHDTVITERFDKVVKLENGNISE